MRSTRLSLVFALVASVAVVACGDDGGGAPPDTMPALMGLGQKCVIAMQGQDCPDNAPACLSFAATAAMGICTPICVMGGMMTTNAQAGIATVTPDPAAPAQTGICTAAFTGTVGTARCGNLVGGFQPPHNPLQANTTYTMVTFTCGVACGTGNVCPGGLVCMSGQCIP